LQAFEEIQAKMESSLQETCYYNFSDPVVQEFLKKVDQQQSKNEQAIELYLLVRDGWKYNPLVYHTKKEHFTASEIMQREGGHCLDKSIILITGLRALGIPAKIHLAKVKNHIGVERIIELLGNDELAPHGYVEAMLNGKWVACAPAFNQSLCEKLGVDVLEFNGKNDSIFQPYNAKGDQFMQYLEDYGTFDDFPYDFVMQTLVNHYPKLKTLMEQSSVFNLDV